MASTPSSGRTGSGLSKAVRESAGISPPGYRQRPTTVSRSASNVNQLFEEPVVMTQGGPYIAAGLYAVPPAYLRIESPGRERRANANPRRFR
jgi:hypothetical protein